MGKLLNKIRTFIGCPLLHDWDDWGPTERDTQINLQTASRYDRFYQVRTCRKCNKTQEREVFGE